MNKRQRLLTILDRQSLAHEIQRVIDERFDGNLSEAARKARLSQPQLYRLTKRMCKAIRWRTLGALRRLIPAKRRRAIEDALLTPVLRWALERYNNWLATSTLPSAGHFAFRLLAHRRPIERARHEAKRGGDVRFALADARAQFPDLFAKFDHFLTSRGHLDSRARLALQRLVEPLCLAEETGWLERSWGELSDKEFKKFVQAGMQREMILLDRSPDVQRAQAELT